jgi:hypothetical protein
MANLTAGKLRKILKDIPDNTPCGVTGHYGEFHPMDLPELEKDVRIDWNSPARMPVALIFEAIDIGPEPD